MYRTVLAVPSELEGKIDQETFDKSRLYQLDKSTFSMAHSLFKEVEFLVWMKERIIMLDESSRGPFH